MNLEILAADFANEWQGDGYMSEDEWEELKSLALSYFKRVAAKVK